MKRCINFMVIVIVVFTYVDSGWGESITWITDNTPGGHFIIGGGTTFDENKPGIEIELYQMVAEKLGLDVTFKRAPWNMCLKQLEHNQVEGLFPASFKQDRMKIGVYPMKGEEVDLTRKTRDNAYYLYALPSARISYTQGEIKVLEGKIGVPIGWSIVEDLKQKELPIKEVPIHRNTPDLLLQKRLEGFICLETVFDAYLNRQSSKYGEIQKLIPPVKEKPYYLMLSHKFVKENPTTAKKIWDSIYDIKQSEEYTKLVDKYID
ncbi:Amino acid ABC transporter periplasmic protein [Desulfamplus magnetovallimortis]|uniref:Amino acid ABC transporter periplasmic protein n=1 Tax=Desulfamplus magnetovallimortis TaxID=1246637 RepID=A0A1W1HHK0_9BACT|nr:transporter substrate-binding domain-containing protein [Desulfamplus magnetovallimortis]SLM31981.1 Amino acid ABC transporter periplasmic protein [Desulfamplus magnetovallimortis]